MSISLKETASEEPGLYLTLDSVLSYSKISDSTRLSLRDKMNIVGVNRLLVSRSGNEVRLLTSKLQRGFSFTEKGYIFTNHELIPEALENRLDNFSMQTEISELPVYKSIGNTWYLYANFVK